MANVPGFLSPRSDLTIRSVPPDKMEEIVNAVVDILGDRVSFSETAIYESQPTEPESIPGRQCMKMYRHPRHRWFYGPDHVVCPGLIVEERTFG